MEGVQAILRHTLSGLMSGLLLILAVALGYAKFSGDWKQFEHCPNRDVLSWDANLRMIQTLDVRSDFLHGNILRGIASWLESPTWPPLHSIIAQLLFIFTGPSTVTEVAIGLAFAVLTCAALLLIGVLVCRSADWPLWVGILLALACMVLMFHSPELTAYFLSAMLETQGMFFFLFTAFAFFKLWTAPGSARWWVLAGSLGLFLTKYPYGHILLVAGAPVVLLFENRSLPDLVGYVRKQYSGRSLIIPGVVIATVILLAFAKFLPGQFLNSKTFKYVFYALVVVLFVDFNWKLWSSRATTVWPQTWRVGYLYCALPILLLTFLNPDRFSSTIGTQLHQQDASRSYFLSIFTSFADFSGPVILWFAILAVAAIVLGVVRRKEFLSAIRRPAFLTFVLIVSHILVLEFLTANKQLRHIYHLLPALFLFSALACMEILRNSKRVAVSFACIVSLGTVPLLLTEKGFLNTGYYSNRYVCWTGSERSLFDPVRNLTSQVDPNRSYVILNRLHEDSAPIPARQWATEFDLLLRMRSSGVVRNDSRRRKADWSEFNGALLIQAECSDAAGNQALLSRALSAGKDLHLANSFSSPDLCVRDFRFSRSDEKQ
ncbi:MAG: hypothetical protein JNM27_17925 [Leptospirales bacterium]|nr:hypothetical protein [Leptospirales bacterium]